MENDLSESSEQSLSLYSPNSEDEFGNPVIVPRVGDQYQAQIPPLVIDCCCPETDLENLQNEFSDGLPVPITWVPCNEKNNENESENIALPILPSRPWKAIEQESFVVGLYIFGKNLNNVKRFLKRKGMGEILGYYYGMFFKSSGYNRWSKGKKMKSKGCIRGEKIFSGWRRLELYKRLFSRASEESRDLLRKINIKYEDNKVSFERYVFTIRRIVGIKAFLEAIAIGKRKQDLTRTTNPNKTRNMPCHVRKTPKGKAFASLTPREIAKFLNIISLSKSRLNDLFWDAVWPRLLENGWHSEQPKCHAVLSSKRSKIFLVPGVDKFSRRNLVKGVQYFDCVTDILNKIASDPSLLVTRTEEEGGSKESETILGKNQNRNGNTYLQPPVLSGDVANFTFTVVDTSLCYMGKTSKVREMRTLPVETASDIPISSHFPSESEKEVPQNESPDNNLSNTYENKEPQVSTYQNISSDGCLAKESQDIYEEDVDSNEQRSRLGREMETHGTLVKSTGHDHEDSDTSSKVAPLQASELCSGALNGRRQSTRNRPLTAKALEAIAYGFLSPARKRKTVEADDYYLSSRPRQLARSKGKQCSIFNIRSTDNDSD